jgi:hypothetical protein
MLTGNALRGGRVFVISPALENAPSAGFPQMSRAQEIFAQMILIQRMLGDELAAVDGSLHTGVYAVDLDVGDLAGRTALYYDNLLTSPLVPAFFGITAEENPARWSEYVALNRRAKAQVLGRLAELGFEPGYAVEDVALRKPKLHLKAQIFLNGAALNLFKQVDLMKIVEETMVQRARQVQGEEYVDIREAWKTSSRLWEEAGRKVRAKARPEDMEKATGYLTVGSHNMDYRGMMMDGEVLYVTASGGLIPGLRDLFVIAGISSWIDDLEELEKLIPAYSEWQRRVGRYIKYAL